MKTEKLITAIANAFTAWRNCQASGNAEWEARWKKRIESLLDEMPHGSGIDNGVEFNWDASETEKLVFTLSFHHMNEGGYYDGWTDHTVTVTPSFVGGFSVNIEGENRNDIHDYLADVIHEALNGEIEVGFA